MGVGARGANRARCGGVNEGGENKIVKKVIYFLSCVKLCVDFLNYNVLGYAQRTVVVT